MFTKSSTARLALEAMDDRAVPTSISAGNLIVTGSNAADTVYVTHWTDANRVPVINVNQNVSLQSFRTSAVTGSIKMYGNGGDDYLHYSGTKAVYADGGAGNDTVHGSQGNDTLIGGTGNDYLNGWDGNDLMIGDDGHDTLLSGAGNDELQGGNGDDWLEADSGDDRLFGQAGSDIMFAGAGNDMIVGGPQLDVAFGGPGKDQFWEVGNDRGKIAAPYKPVRSLLGSSDFWGVADAKSGEGDRVYS